MNDLTIRPARAGEAHEVVRLWNAAAAWLASRGIDQWQYPPRLDRIAGSIERGECYLAEQDGRIIGTVTVDSYADPDFWQPNDEPENALYVHRMAITRDAAGQEVGTALLDWAADLAAKAGKKWLRLDAWRTNTGLHRYYAERGFRSVRVVNRANRRSGALYQRPITD
ncbi:MAG TPA: GNAT family N-acetyltransferase [Mycobacteriales bacterium]|nr:GNAT family N-acetyltransferase [Mycobacteriales bacterium]